MGSDLGRGIGLDLRRFRGRNRSRPFPLPLPIPTMLSPPALPARLTRPIPTTRPPTTPLTRRPRTRRTTVPRLRTRRHKRLLAPLEQDNDEPDHDAPALAEPRSNPEMTRALGSICPRWSSLGAKRQLGSEATWLMETAYRHEVLPTYHITRPASRCRTPQSNRALARATPRSDWGGLARATPRKWPGFIPLLTACAATGLLGV